MSAWRFKPIEVDQQRLLVVCQLRLRFTAEGEMNTISRSVLNLAMDEVGELRRVSGGTLSEEEIVQRVIDSQTSVHIYISGDTPFDVVQERVRLLEELGSANVVLSPGALTFLDERLCYNADFKGLRSPEIGPRELRSLQERARVLLEDSGAFLYRIFSDANGDIVSVDHREGPRSIEIESQILGLKVTPGRLGADAVSTVFPLRLDPFDEGRETTQLSHPEVSSRLFVFTEDRLFYTHRSDGILPPQVDLEYLGEVADRARNYLDFPVALQFRVFCDETGQVVSIEAFGGAHLPQVEADLSRAVVGPGTLEGTPVPVVFFLSLPVDGPQMESGCDNSIRMDIR